MRAFVTGAAGFVGKHLCKRLLDEGHDVVALIRPGGKADGLEGCDVREADIGFPADVAKAAAGCDVLFHLAGSHDENAGDEVLGWLNVAGTQNVFSACRHAGLRRGILLSSTDVSLSRKERHGWTEDQGLTTPSISAIGRTKALAEESAIGLGSRDFAPAVIRASRIWGPGDTTTLPSLIAESTSQGGILIPGKGTNLITTTYVENVVHALLLAAEHDEAVGNIFQINDDEFTLSRDFYSEVAEIFGLPAIRHSSKLIFEVKTMLGLKSAPSTAELYRRGFSHTLSCQYARETLGYAPQKSMHEGMQAVKTWAASIDRAAIQCRATPQKSDIEAQVTFANAS